MQEMAVMKKVMLELHSSRDRTPMIRKTARADRGSDKHRFTEISMTKDATASTPAPTIFVSVQVLEIF